MLIHFSTPELLGAQIRRFADRAAEAGADVTIVELPRLWHSAHVLAGTLREATDAVHDVGTFYLWRPGPRLGTKPICHARHGC